MEYGGLLSGVSRHAQHHDKEGGSGEEGEESGADKNSGHIIVDDIWVIYKNGYSKSAPRNGLRNGMNLLRRVQHSRSPPGARRTHSSNFPPQSLQNPQHPHLKQRRWWLQLPLLILNLHIKPLLLPPPSPRPRP